MASSKKNLVNWFKTLPKKYFCLVKWLKIGSVISSTRKLVRNSLLELTNKKRSELSFYLAFTVKLKLK